MTQEKRSLKLTQHFALLHVLLIQKNIYLQMVFPFFITEANNFTMVAMTLKIEKSYGTI